MLYQLAIVMGGHDHVADIVTRADLSANLKRRAHDFVCCVLVQRIQRMVPSSFPMNVVKKMVEQH